MSKPPTTARKTNTVAGYISDRIEVSPKTQREIAEEIGFESANLITMLKQGRTKVPLDRVPKLAEALGVSPAYLMRLALAEYYPATLTVIEDVLTALVTENERAIIELIREASGGSDPAPAGKRERDLITEAFRR